MEEYTQITLDEWMQWKEDIRRKLAETADNFVYIGYRLKQIRDSGMFGGAADIFEFAQNEYGLGKSTVSRFIAINEKYSEGGNSLELKEEFRGFSSSKLSEMLTLPDNEIQLITEKTTIRAIRELKKFDAEDPDTVQAEESAAGMEGGAERTPLEKCLIDFFKPRKHMLNGIMGCLETDPPEYKQAAELMVPSGQATYRKGIVFLFLYDWSEGVRYKLMTETEPVHMDWPGFLNIIYNIYGACDTADVWEDFYGREEQEKEPEEKPAPARSDQGFEPVATSQREAETEENLEKGEEDKNVDETAGRKEANCELHGSKCEIGTTNELSERDEEADKENPPAAVVDSTGHGSSGSSRHDSEPTDDASGTGRGYGTAYARDGADDREEPQAAGQSDDQISIEDLPGCMPDKEPQPQESNVAEGYLMALKDNLDAVYKMAEDGDIAGAEERLEAVRGTLHKIAEVKEKYSGSIRNS